MAVPEGSPVFALVAGEDSGDQLGADLILALRARFAQARFVGVGGARMRSAGLDAWHDIGELSVMGLTEVLRHLPRLLRLRRALRRRITTLRPDVFIGIDAPDFNLGLERALQRRGIRTVHYVSPSIWAWRPGRAKTIGKSCDRVLCLFPMEPALYARHNVTACFVGHPLADRFPLQPDRAAARRELALDAAAPVLAVLPGSRLSEVRRLGAIFLEAATRVAAELPDVQIVLPTANERCLHALEILLDAAAATDAGAARPRPRLMLGHAHQALLAADVALLASGTASLEALLAKCPMVAGYRIAPATYAIVKGFGLLKTRVYALPNVLAGRTLVPELMQHACTPQRLAAAVVQQFRDVAGRGTRIDAFREIHLALRAEGGAAAAAARAIEQQIALSGPTA